MNDPHIKIARDQTEWLVDFGRFLVGIRCLLPGVELEQDRLNGHYKHGVCVHCHLGSRFRQQPGSQLVRKNRSTFVFRRFLGLKYVKNLDAVEPRPPPPKRQ